MPEPAEKARRRRVVIGLGNEILSDDGAGIHAVRELRRRHAGEAEFTELAVGGLALLDYIAGYDVCMIVDALRTGAHPPGTILRCLQTSGGEPHALTSSHQIDLAQVISLGELLGAAMPRSVVVWGIEAEDITTFRPHCTGSVARALPRLVEAIAADLASGGDAGPVPAGRWQVVQETVPS